MVINHLIPATPEGHEWMWEETKRLLDEYPDLKEKVDQWMREEKEKDKEAEEEVKRIIREWEEARRRRRA